MTDSSAFEEFVQMYQDMVFGTAVRLLGDPSEAEDVSQTVFLRAFERFDSLHGRPEAGGWLKTVATNLCLNHLKRFRARWRLFSERSRQDRSGPAFEETLAAPGSHGEDLLRAEKLAKLERSIRSLPRKQRVPLVLFHFGEHSYQEIANLLQVSVGKVKTDIHRGRLALRKLMVTDDDA